MIDFAGVKTITIPEGAVRTISRGSEILWRKQKYKCEVEYLESTETQWIDTGVVGTQDTKVECSFIANSYTNVRYVSLLGYYSSNENSVSMFFANTTGFGAARFGNANTTKMVVSLMTKYNLTVDKTVIRLNDTAIEWNSSNTFATEGTLLLFKRNTETYGNFNGKIYSCKLYDNGTLVRDFIPVLDWNDRPCMYDKVTDELFYNAGTGEFLYA